MKLFPNAHATHPQWHMAAALVLAQLQAQMLSQHYARQPSLGLLYITDHYVEDAAALLRYLAQQLPMVADWSGTVGMGVVGNNVEYFDEPALSVMLCDVPPGQYRVFSGRAPLSSATATAVAAPFAAHTALVHADGRTPDLAELLLEMAGRTATGSLFGGVAASRGASVASARHAGSPSGVSGVMCGGLSGVAFTDRVELVSRVTQDSQPIGPQAVITEARDNVVLRLDGEPALDALLQTLSVNLGGDTQRALRSVRATLAGLTDAGAPKQQRTGHFGADTRVRHIVGLDMARGGVALAERVEAGMHLTFCQRHVAAARADLMRICTEIREELSPDLLGQQGQPEGAEAGNGPLGGRSICGAIYVSCTGRGGRHFGGPSAELQIVRNALGDVPLVGFFASGEIAGHWLYGYTGVLTVFAGAVG